MTTLRKPTWWQLGATVPVMAGLLWLVYRTSLPSGWREGVQAGILIFIYFLIWRWLRAYVYAVMARRSRHDRYDPTANGAAHPASGPSLLLEKSPGPGGRSAGARRGRDASYEE